MPATRTSGTRPRCPWRWPTPGPSPSWGSGRHFEPAGGLGPGAWGLEQCEAWAPWRLHAGLHSVRPASSHLPLPQLSPDSSLDLVPSVRPLCWPPGPGLVQVCLLSILANPAPCMTRGSSYLTPALRVGGAALTRCLLSPSSPPPVAPPFTSCRGQGSFLSPGLLSLWRGPPRSHSQVLGD